MEFKAAEDADESKLSELADDAVKQIKDRQYAVELLTEGVSDVQLYGISFSRKKATVKTMPLMKEDKLE